MADTFLKKYQSQILYFSMWINRTISTFYDSILIGSAININVNLRNGPALNKLNKNKTNTNYKTDQLML